MPKPPTTKPKERIEIKVIVLRHMEPKDQEMELNGFADDSWELISVSEGIAYLQRFATH